MSSSQYTIIIIVLASLFALMLLWSMLLVPLLRRKAAKKQEDVLNNTVASFRPGDKILLASGIRALFVKQKGDVIHAKIAENVIVKVDKHAIMGVYK